MMEKQSLEFITGYIFSKIENRILNAHVNKVKRISPIYVSVPKLWFGLRPIKSKVEDLIPSVRFDLPASLGALCRSLNTEHAAYEFCIFAEPDEQYIRFTIEGVLMSAVKEMTVADIEKELGYKIKIVG